MRAWPMIRSFAASWLSALSVVSILCVPPVTLLSSSSDAFANSAAIKVGYSAEAITGQTDKWNLKIHIINNSNGLRVCQFSVFHLDGGSTEFATDPPGWTHQATKIDPEDGTREMIYINTDPSKKVGPKTTQVFGWEICSTTAPKLAPLVVVDWKDIFGNDGNGLCISQPVATFLRSEDEGPPESQGYVRDSTDPASNWEVVPDTYIQDEGSAIASGDLVGNPAGGYTATLTSPLLDLSNELSPALQFQSVVRNETAATARVMGSSDGGATWTELWFQDSMCTEPDPCVEPALVEIFPLGIALTPANMFQWEFQLPPGSKTVNPPGNTWVVDDIYVLGDEQPEPPVPVAFAYFEATRAAVGATVRWGLNGVGTAAFHVYRTAADGSREPLGSVFPSGGTNSYEWTDSSPPLGETNYWLEVDDNGNRWWHGPAKLSSATIGLAATLYAPTPNPLVDQTTIAFLAPGTGPYRVAVFDVRGRRVTTLATGARTPEARTVVWSARAEDGQRVSAGTYFVQLMQDQRTVVRKVVVKPGP